MQKQTIVAAAIATSIIAAFGITLALSQTQEVAMDAVFTDDLDGRVEPSLLDPARTNYILRMETIIGPVGDRYFRAKVDAMRAALKKPECDFIVAATVDAYRSSNRDLTFGVQCRNGAVLSISESRENNVVLEGPAQSKTVTLPPKPIIVPQRSPAPDSVAAPETARAMETAPGVAGVRQTAAALCGALGEHADPYSQTITVGEGANGKLEVDCSAP